MEIQREENNGRGRFFVKEGEKDLAEMVYRTEKNRIIIEHTEVDESLKGQGVGLRLVAESVDYARKNDIKITPVCSFAAAIFKKKEEYQDVLA